jgi:hypothetical protein
MEAAKAQNWAVEPQEEEEVIILTTMYICFKIISKNYSDQIFTVYYSATLKFLLLKLSFPDVHSHIVFENDVSLMKCCSCILVLFKYNQYLPCCKC